MTKKIILSVLVVVIALAVGGYLYIYQGHRNIAEETAAYKMEAKALAGEFLQESEAASAKYLDKTITLSGKVTETEQKGVTLDNAAYCEFSEGIDKTVVADGQITIKGRCIGYDELLEVVKLDQCIIID